MPDLATLLCAGARSCATPPTVVLIDDWQVTGGIEAIESATHGLDVM